jgi:hypothetical protein
MPGTIVIDAGKLADVDGKPLLPSVAAETIVVDYADVLVMPTRTAGLLDHKACMSKEVGIISGCSG